jgi:hypothetical protein
MFIVIFTRTIVIKTKIKLEYTDVNYITIHIYIFPIKILLIATSMLFLILLNLCSPVQSVSYLDILRYGAKKKKIIAPLKGLPTENIGDRSS